MLGFECVFTGGLISDESDNFYKKHTFLPLQHQLQEMTLTGVGCQAKMYSFYEEFLIENSRYVDDFSSMEELWLAYIMLFENQKKWNNTKGVWE